MQTVSMVEARKDINVVNGWLWNRALNNDFFTYIVNIFTQKACIFFIKWKIVFIIDVINKQYLLNSIIS
jgi:hypothetical protein